MTTEQEVKEKTIKRFWSKIKFGKPNECWEWQAGTFKHGKDIRGSFHAKQEGKDKTYVATRYLYKMLFGGLPEGICVLHNCPNGDNPLCVNPNHLWTGTQLDNIRDRDRKGRQGAAIGSKQGSSKLKESDVSIIKSMLFDGISQLKIAKMFKISSSVIGDINREKIWRHVPGKVNKNSRKLRALGSENGKSKLDESKVVLIKKRLATNESHSSIGRDFGVTKHAIRDINRGATWRHVQIS